jgi:type I restriction enzyme S subunit
MRSESPFEAFYIVPSRNGVSPPKVSRGSGAPMIGMGDLFGHPWIKGHKMERVPLTATERGRAMLQSGDLLFARRSVKLAGAGVCSIFWDSDEPTTFESSLIRVRLDRSIADPLFFFYYFRSQPGRQRIETIVEQTAVAGIKASSLGRLSVSVPQVDEQKRIAQVLRSLDEKIDNNLRIARTLEEIATALFKARFVDFIGQDDLVESEVGPIPQGWAATPVGDLARYVNGKAFTKFGNGRGRMVIRIADLRSGPGGSTVYSDHEAEPDFVAAPGDILFAWSGSLDVYRWHRPEALINQHIFKVIPEGYPNWFVFHTLKYVMPHFQAIAADKATTMGHIKRADLHALSIATPPTSGIREHDVVFAPLYEQALVARKESEMLVQIRDQLLPRLISGRLLVPDSARHAEEVA